MHSPSCLLEPCVLTAADRPARDPLEMHAESRSSRSTIAPRKPPPAAAGPVHLPRSYTTDHEPHFTLLKRAGKPTKATERPYKNEFSIKTRVCHVMVSREGVHRGKAPERGCDGLLGDGTGALSAATAPSEKPESAVHAARARQGPHGTRVSGRRLCGEPS